MLQNNIKNKTIEEKIDVLRNYLSDNNSDDKLLALNIFLLIKKNNNFEKDFFEHEDVIFSNIVEYIDIADALSDELNEVIQNIIAIYLSCITNCSVLNLNYDTQVSIPIVYLHILYMMDFFTLSRLMREVLNFIELNNNKYYLNVYKESYEIILSLSNKMSCFSIISNDGIQIINNMVKE